MVIVSICLLPVIVTGHRFTSRESTATTGVLRLTRAVTATLTTCYSVVLTTMSIGTPVASVKVSVPSQNSKCSFTSIRVYANGAKTERIKIFSGAFKAPRIVPALGGHLDPRSESGMTSVSTWG